METQLRFWNAFREYMANNSTIECQKPQSRQWMNHSTGWPSDIHLTAIISTRKPETGGPEIRVEVGFLGTNGKQRFLAFKQRREEIERAYGAPLTWHTPPNGKEMCKVYVSKNTDFRREEMWAGQRQWLRAHVELFQRVFDPVVHELEQN
jgi:hypothetical protein